MRMLPAEFNERIGALNLDLMTETAIKEIVQDAIDFKARAALVAVDDFPTDAFDRFWSLYPPGRKGGKKAARSKFDGIRRRREVTFVGLMAGLQRFVDTRPDPQYTKAPEVWLNKGCWDDEYLPQGGDNAPNRNGTGKIGFSGIAARLRHGIAAGDQLSPAQSPENNEPFDGR